MSLLERIRQALDGVDSLPWTQRGSDVEDSDGIVRADCPWEAEARLIAEAPGLLSECARRLDPGDTDVAQVVSDLRDIAARSHGIGHVGAAHRAADLLAQVFLDPQESDG